MGEFRFARSSRKINMKTLQLVLFGMAVVAIKAQDPDFDFVGSNFKFKCPEPNGLFADPEQCDLYYVCEDNIATPELCEDGLLFDDSQRNKERCKLPHSVDCGKREFVQEPQAGIGPRCDTGDEVTGLKTIEGFTCPGKETIGPQGLL